MPTQTPNLDLTLYNSTTDQAVTFPAARAAWGGTETTSNFNKIDTAVGEIQDDIAAIESSIADIESSIGLSANGWNTLSATLTYVSADAPTFVVSSNTNLTSTLSVGMKLWFQNAATTVYGFITQIDTWSGSSQLITIYCGTDYTVANSAITLPYYSREKAPHGFPLDKSKWSVKFESVTTYLENLPDRSTWYNIGSISCDIPIGQWRLWYTVGLELEKTTTAAEKFEARAALSEYPDDFSDKYLWTYLIGTVPGSFTVANVAGTLYREKYLTLASKTTFYLLVFSNTDNLSVIRIRSSISPTVIMAECAYL